MKLKKFKKRLSTEQLMAILNTKYPHINYIPGENLNLMDATNDILRKMWADKIKYPTITHIKKKMNMCERSILKMAKLNKLPSRECI